MQKQKLRLDELQVDSFVITSNLPSKTILGGDASVMIGCTQGACMTEGCATGTICGTGGNGDSGADPRSALCPSGYLQFQCG